MKESDSFFSVVQTFIICIVCVFLCECGLNVLREYIGNNETNDVKAILPETPNYIVKCTKSNTYTCKEYAIYQVTNN